ncbi:2-methylaconitate cis-trans isomerase PrpF family protein [Roseomonas xinghualingensis]|uniref:2-methylaconitate cis-trans isomerase PrpF family protein n=1 Tax=Roseomonas xinghualingensis TaxID=2986475 RepID=UPI0021F0C268|nr:PrpF domain-containing protein [Roseomonas sp. SXEYE001]MCV4210110.1 PrpF family protein [Roseomonas sp. SXEYE001]
MDLRAIPAVFMRGGTSKAVMFHARDLPASPEDWAPILTAALGSPDPFGRQLDGMGGGVSSLSKACVMGPPTLEDADLDYTFAQVMIREPRIELRQNCGNMSSAVGPFAVEEGLVRVPDGDAMVRIHNTNTRKIIHAHFAVAGGMPSYAGDLSIPGVSGTGAPIRLDFLDPGGASTGKLLPTGRPLDLLVLEDGTRIEASLVDAANACAFVRARDIGLEGTELPETIEARPDVMARLQAIRVAASVAMGIAPDPDAARAISAIPFVGFVSPAAPFRDLSGEAIPAQSMDLAARIISNGQPHRALPLTISLCTAVAARIGGTLVHEALASGGLGNGPLRLGMPSGILTVGAEVEPKADGTWHARAGSFYRTARRLFDGRVWVPAGV